MGFRGEATAAEVAIELSALPDPAGLTDIALACEATFSRALCLD